LSDDFAVIGGLATGEGANQGRFPVAVSADDTDSIAIIKPNGDGVQNKSGGELDSQVFSAE
jgi:hypothetical protein